MATLNFMPSPNNPPHSRLFVGGLPYDFTEGDLLALFVPFGRVIAVKIMHTQWGKSRGLGFVEFDNLDSAIAAKTKMHNHLVDLDRTIIVDYAAPDPFNTPEGQQRHQQAVVEKEKRYSKFAKNASSSPNSTPKSFGKKIIKPVFGSTRQSVYDSRTHHSHVGAKFASRNKKK
jgi:RNA recognition motif-containing protein